MKIAALVFPHQLFEQVVFPNDCDVVYLVEELLFFRQYPFHKQKIALHRASMKFYEQYLQQHDWPVKYVDAQQAISDVRLLIPHLKQQGIDAIHYIDTSDNWLEQRIKTSAQSIGLTIHQYSSALFINSFQDMNDYFTARSKLFQTDFYIQQRKHQRILVDDKNKPLGGKWSFDDENRLKYPKGKTPPDRHLLPPNSFYKEALQYTEQHFHNNYGTLNSQACYPCTHTESKQWLQQFLQHMLLEFGPYEDAIVASNSFLHHSVLTPMLNVGLLTPQYVLDETITFAEQHAIPLNSLEGFIRQILGWREFIRGVYETKGTEQRTYNYWQFTRKIPEGWWQGTTGIAPIDITIKKILSTGYCHHIERLMVLGNFMLLCEFDPDEVYRWFMTLFIDAYDWVMVPNVIGMGLHADGGKMMTKPYISGGSYISKMSNYCKGCAYDPKLRTGDNACPFTNLYWNFLAENQERFARNHRMFQQLNGLKRLKDLSEVKKESSRILDGLSKGTI